MEKHFSISVCEFLSKTPQKCFGSFPPPLFFYFKKPFVLFPIYLFNNFLFLNSSIYKEQPVTVQVAQSLPTIVVKRKQRKIEIFNMV